MENSRGKRKALTQEFPLCVKVTMGEAEVCENSKKLSAAFGTRRTRKEWFIQLWLMVLPGFNLPVKLFIQGQDSVTKHPLSTCHITVLLPEHFTTKEIQAAVICFIQTTVLGTDTETGLVENLKKKKPRNLSFSKAGASPSFPVALPPVGGRQSRAAMPGRWRLGGVVPIPRLLNGRIAGMQIVLVMQLLMVRFTAEASHHFKPHNGSLGDGTLQN